MELKTHMSSTLVWCGPDVCSQHYRLWQPHCECTEPELWKLTTWRKKKLRIIKQATSKYIQLVLAFGLEGIRWLSQWSCWAFTSSRLWFYQAASSVMCVCVCCCMKVKLKRARLLSKTLSDINKCGKTVFASCCLSSSQPPCGLFWLAASPVQGICMTNQANDSPQQATSISVTLRPRQAFRCHQKQLSLSTYFWRAMQTDQEMLSRCLEGGKCVTLCITWEESLLSLTFPNRKWHMRRVGGLCYSWSSSVISGLNRILKYHLV